MKKIIFYILTLFIIIATGITIYILSSNSHNTTKQNISEITYKEIDKMLSGFIFSSEGNIAKEVRIKINGKQYTETSSYKDYFAGVIEINGEVIEIRSTNNITAVTSDFDTTNYYFAINPTPNKADGMIEYAAYIKISKDFNTAYGYTLNLKNNYGQGAYFKSLVI